MQASFVSIYIYNLISETCKALVALPLFFDMLINQSIESDREGKQYISHKCGIIFMVTLSRYLLYLSVQKLDSALLPFFFLVACESSQKSNLVGRYWPIVVFPTNQGKLKTTSTKNRVNGTQFKELNSS